MGSLEREFEGGRESPETVALGLHRTRSGLKEGDWH